MTTLVPFRLVDVFTIGFNSINLDAFTETYSASFYMMYLEQWEEYFHSVRDSNQEIIAYCIGKHEGTRKLYHGHISAVTVADSQRRLGIASMLMQYMERVTAEEHSLAYFMDLFVRKSNSAAIRMYEKLGYVVYRTVLNYYRASDDSVPAEDAYDMRKPMARDVQQSSLKCKKRYIRPSDLEWNTA